MPRTITKTVYTYAELRELGDPQAIERARQWLADGQTDHDWYGYEYDLWKTALAQIGFEHAEIEFSGFGSQGDGASFTASVNLTKLIDFLAMPPAASEVIAGQPEAFRGYVVHKCNGVRANPKFSRLHWIALDGAHVTRGNRSYCHEGTCAFEAGDIGDTGEYVSDTSGSGNWKSDTPRVRQLYNDFVEAAEALRRDICLAIYRDLDAQYEYLTGDHEAIADFADANEYTFTVLGYREG